MDQVTQIREKVDIVALIAEYLPLKKLGHNFKTNCPFHGEKTPSFVVSPERQIWHCFGCGKGGDAFTFLMEYENLEFVEALRILAQKVGIELASTKNYSPQTASKKEKIYTLNMLASEYYHFVLTKHAAGKKALEYLTDTRHIKAPLLKTFMLGYSPSEGSALSTYLMKKKGYPKEDLFEAGLAVFKNGRVSDFFVHRIMFPLTDHRGNIVGFSGRVLDDNGYGPKYMNTRDTLVYHKGELFFGLHIAKDEIKKTGRAIIVEGEFDAINSFHHGITNTVAIKGTALTEEQVNLLSRFAKKISLCFDMDDAGQQALQRSLPIIEQKGLTTTVIKIENAKDADEALDKDPVAYKKAVEHDIDIYDFLQDYFTKKFDPSTPDGKKSITQSFLPFLAVIENEVVKEHFYRKLSTVLDTSYESVIRQAEKLTKRAQVAEVVEVKREKRERMEILEEYIMALVVQAENPNEAISQISELESYQFKSPAYSKILERIIVYGKGHESFDTKTFLQGLPIELVPTFDTCFLLPIPKFETAGHYRDELKKAVRELQLLSVKNQVREIAEQIRQKEKSGDSEELQALQGQIALLMPRLQELQASQS